MAWRLMLSGTLAFALAACGQGGRDGTRGSAGSGGMMSGGGMGSGMMRGGGTAAAPRPVPAAAAATGGCPAVDQKLVDGGRAIFAGPGNCQSCHGGNAKGTGLAPDLTDPQWLNIDGSYGSIAQLVRVGVPRPKQHAAPMPPMGGAALAPEQVCAVAAYVFSLGHATG